MKRLRVYTERVVTALFGLRREEFPGVLLIAAIALTAFYVYGFTPSVTPDEDFLNETLRLSDSLKRAYYSQYFRDTVHNTFRSVEQTVVLSNTANRNRVHRQTYTPKPEVFIELNGADSAALTTVKGIGPVISARIVRYRDRLGGFVSCQQLKEICGIDEENFGQISRQFYIDSAGIQKININFATLNDLARHPYITHSMAKRITEARKLKGGWSNLGELTEEDIILPHEAEKISDYVVFR